MKKLITIFVLLFFASSLYSQANKPDAGSFGVRIGINMPNFGFGVTLSKMMKKNIECGTGIGFSINTHKSSQTQTGLSMNSTVGLINVKNEYKNSWLNYSVRLTPYLVYHIPTKNNLDVYAGARLLLGINQQCNYKYENRIYADNFESKTYKTIAFPLSYSVGAGALIGSDYYFLKNMAVGLSGNLGFSTTILLGNQLEKTTVVHSGSINPSQGTVYTEGKFSATNITTNFGLDGNVALNLSFFFARKAKSKD